MTTPAAEADARDLHGDIHTDLHAEQGAARGHRPDRHPNPVIKALDLAWLEFEKPDLDRAERFAHDFGFTTVARTPASLHLRGALAGSQCMVIRKGPVSRFVAPVFRAADRASDDLTIADPGANLMRALTDQSRLSLLVRHHEPTLGLLLTALGRPAPRRC